MSIDADEMDTATTIAEEILRQIFGDDFTGCPVRLESIAAIVSRGLRRAEMEDELRGLYETAIEALHLLSTPPAHGAHLPPELMPSLLSDRLDSIHKLTQQLMATAAACQQETPLPQPS